MHLPRCDTESFCVDRKTQVNAFYKLKNAFRFVRLGHQLAIKFLLKNGNGATEGYSLRGGKREGTLCTPAATTHSYLPSTLGQ
jgi:hypothetical protein